ncbi:RNA polymerase I-specific transcription initiation factor-domain-containing protein [Xylaria cf. heliscus]|nr:RNA polymerase I-specific transcription initiation factor-domain-containing protein [Xylaria cf. heliscus]
MANVGNDSDEYLPDSDDSDAEDGRPNRWTGPPSTWQQLNSAEIDTLTALNEIHNQDLSIHLYNAFALKHRHRHQHGHNTSKTCYAARPVPNQDVDITTGQPVKEDKWMPPNAWTAWPLPANVVPHPEFMKRTDAADEHFTFRMQSLYTPKNELEEVISATTLRLAKEQFRARKISQQDENIVEPDPESSYEEGSSVEMSSEPSRVRSKSRAKSGSKSRFVKYESASEVEIMDVDNSRVKKRSPSTRSERIRLKTVVATDDELSYTLLRPSTQRILGKLDTTLKVLHSAQESRTHCPSESEASDASSRSQSRSRSRSRGPSRTRTQSPDARHRRPQNSRLSSIARDSVVPETAGEVKKRGRPRKEYPRIEGETDRDYVVRIARLRKKPIPHFEDDDPEPASDATPAPNSAAEYTDRNARAKPRARKARSKSRLRQKASKALSDIASADETSEKLLRLPKLSRVRLRDWRDVLGAAALAGFPAPALDRAARRCADLFGASFVLHTLQEGPPGQTRSDKHVRYEPGMKIPSLLDSEASNDERPSQRQCTHTPGATSMEPSEGEGQSRRPAKSKQAQSRYKSGADEKFLCMVSNCPRAVEPFDRRQNLVRHLRLIHNYHYPSDELRAEAASGDEMHGTVHVDGFLKPIKMRPGWGGDDDGDAAKEKRKPKRRVKKKSRAEMADTRMRDADSTTGYEVSD